MIGIILNVIRDVTKSNSPYAKIRVAYCNGSSVDKKLIYVWSTPQNFVINQGTFLNVPDSALTIKSDSDFISTKFESCSFVDDKHTGLFEGELTKLLNIISKVVTKEQWDTNITNLSFLFKSTKLKQFFLEKAASFYPKYSQWTAATANHHAYEGGLINHTNEMLSMFSGIYSFLPFEVSPDVVSIALLYHDYGKLYEYSRSDDGSFSKNEIMPLLGHVFLSAHIVYNDLMRYLNIHNYSANDTVIAIVHAVLSHHEKLEWGSPVLPATNEAFIVSRLDEISGHGAMYNDAANMEFIKSLGATHVVLTSPDDTNVPVE